MLRSMPLKGVYDEYQRHSVTAVQGESFRPSVSGMVLLIYLCMRMMTGESN